MEASRRISRGRRLGVDGQINGYRASKKVTTKGDVCVISLGTLFGLSNSPGTGHAIAELLCGHRVNKLQTPHAQSRSQTLWSSRVVSCQVDTWQVEVPCHYTVKTNTASSVGGNTGLDYAIVSKKLDSWDPSTYLSEHVNVFLDSRASRINPLLAQTRLELNWVVNTLAAAQNFLP